MFESIVIEKEPRLLKIIREYILDCDSIEDKDDAMQFFADFNTKVPAKLIRQTLFAGMWFYHKHRDEIKITGMESVPSSDIVVWIAHDGLDYRVYLGKRGTRGTDICMCDLNDGIEIAKDLSRTLGIEYLGVKEMAPGDKK